MAGPDNRWLRTKDLSGDAYDARYDERAAAGENVHGEADFVMRYAPRSVLDAGCGTGRVARELARRGVEVVGVDLDQDMLATARRRSPELELVQADLASFDLGHQINPIRVYWWLVAFPGGFLVITLLALNFIGDGLRDAWDVRGTR